MSTEGAFDAFRVALAGRNVVDASAGTGKTYAITSLVVRLVVEQRLRIKDILVVTFTEAATAELRDRVRKRLREAWEMFFLLESGRPLPASDLAAYAQSQHHQTKLARQWLELALEEVDEAPISTIHGFCHRVLQEAALESGLPFETNLTADARPLRDEAVFDFHSRDLAAQPMEAAREIVDGTSLAQWQGLADKVFRGPDAKLYPTEPEDRAALWLNALQALRFCWRRGDIEKLLLGFKGFPKSFPKHHLTRWCNEIDDMLAQGVLPQKPCAALQYLVNDGLRQRSEGGEIPHHPAFEVLGQISELLQSLYKAGAQSVVAARLRFVEYLRTELPKLKAATGTITFDDLLLRLRDALRGPAAAQLVNVVRRQYHAALIDEFQDTDPVQFSIFEALFSNTESPLFLIGDPKQAIYGFRGADVNAYLEAVHVPGTRYHSMGTNWRSDPLLLDAVNALFQPGSAQPQPFVIEGIRFQPVKPRPAARDVAHGAAGEVVPPLDVILVEDEDDLTDSEVARLVAADISRVLAGALRLDEQTAKPADVAVLTRTNKQAVLVQSALRALQIPAVLLGDKSVLDADEKHELTIVLAAMAEPTNAAAIRKALATLLMGVSAQALVDMEEDAETWSSWSERFRQWHQLWIDEGFVQAFRAWFDSESVGPRLLRHLEGERKITNLLHLMELIHRAAREGHLGPAGVLQWLAQGPRNAEGGVAPDEAQIRLESDEAAVKITTVHRAKGLEYPIVYCPYVCHDILLMNNDQAIIRFHDKTGHGALDLGSTSMNAHLDLARWDALAENVRLLYVALTRAKHRCTLIWGYRKGIKETALAWLLYPLPWRGSCAESPFGSLGRLNPDQLMRPIEAWQARAPGAVGLRRASREPGLAYVAPAPALPLNAARVVRMRIENWQRTTSFSAMNAAAKRVTLPAHAAVDALTRDRDQGVPATALVFAHDAEVPLADFPRGAKAGNFFHELLEVVDFGADAAALAPATKAQLELYRFPTADWEKQLPSTLVQILATPMTSATANADAFSLRDLPQSDRVAELEFALPLSSPVGNAPLQDQLAAAFAVDARSDVERQYPKQLAQLHLGKIQGFLKGFIDLVFVRKGRYFLADYKTNHLGRTWQSYAHANLETAMAQGHYFLQSHLYALALHRHLSRTLGNYNYETAFGGVFYLFLRGMGGAARPDSGVFFHRPTQARLLALESLFASQGKVS